MGREAFPALGDDVIHFLAGGFVVAEIGADLIGDPFARGEGGAAGECFNDTPLVLGEVQDAVEVAGANELEGHFSADKHAEKGFV